MGKKQRRPTMEELNGFLTLHGLEYLIGKRFNEIASILEQRENLQPPRNVNARTRLRRVLHAKRYKHSVDKGRLTGAKKIPNDRAVRKFYQTYEWRKLRYQIFKRYGRVCMCCGTVEGIMHVDHIKPIRKYWHLRFDENNLQVLCDNCNHGKANWDETDWRCHQQSQRVIRVRLSDLRKG